MYVCRECEQPINQASEICPYCGADLTAAPAGEAATPKKKLSLPKIFLYWGIVLACFSVIFWFALPLRQANPAPEAEARALDAVSRLNASIRSYAAASGNYPSSLEALGQRAREAAQWAQSAGYEVVYSPAQPDEDGRVRHYALLARPGNYGYRNFYTDDTGIVRSTRENRPASAQDPPI